MFTEQEATGVPREVWLCFGVCALLFVALSVMVVQGTSGFWYDETWYLATVDALRQKGQSVEFLRNLPGPAGPLYTWVHYLLAPLTGLEPLKTRLATIFLFVLTVGAVCLAARFSGLRFAALRAPQLLGAPVIYVTIGTALTEMPAMLAFSLHLAILLLAVQWSERSRAVAVAWGALAGLCFGLAVTGRQTLLPAIAALPVLGLGDRRAWWPLASCALTSLVLPAIVFAAWGGLTPPRTAFVGSGFSVGNLITAFGYAGLCYVVVDASWLVGRMRIYAAVLVAGLVVNLIWGLLTPLPFMGTAYSLLPQWALSPYSRFTGGLFLGWGLVFMVELADLLRRAGTVQRFFVLGSVLTLGSALKMTIYGGRYVVVSLPPLLLLALHRAPDTRWKALRLAVAGVVGLVSLNAHLKYAIRL